MFMKYGLHITLKNPIADMFHVRKLARKHAGILSLKRYRKTLYI
jgi:hypothetical protein